LVAGRRETRGGAQRLACVHTALASSRIDSGAKKRQAALGATAAIAYVFVWASGFVPSQVLARGAPPLSILSFRFLIAGGLLLGGAKLAGLSFPRDPRTWLRLFAVGVGSNALYLGLTYIALRHLSAGMGSIVASTNPLVVALVAPFVLREPLTARKMTGLLLGFGGVVLAMHTRANAGTAQPRDVLLAFIGVISFVASNIVFKRMTDRPHPVVLNGGQLTCAGLALIPAGLLPEGAPHIDWTPALIASLAFLVLVLSIGASLLWFWILQHGEASRVSAYFFLMPIFGLLVGAALLNEPLALSDGVGLAIIAAGLWLVARA